MGDQDFVKPFLNHIISTLQHFVFVFPSDPETGDNSYACQPIFNNSHLTFLRTVNNKTKPTVFTQNYFGIPPNIKINVNELYNNGKFISIEDFNSLFINRFSFSPTENSYLALKSKLSELFGPQGKKRKYPPVVLNKTTPPGSFSSVEEFFSKPIKGSKKFRRILHRPKYDFPTDRWQKILNNFSINRDLIKKLYPCQ